MPSSATGALDGGSGAWADALELDESEQRIQMAQITGVARGHGLPGPSRAQDHVGVDDVRRTACCEQSPDTGGVHSVEGDDVGGRLSYETTESGLARRVAHRLRESCGGDGHSRRGLHRTRQQRDDAAVPAVEADVGASIQSHAASHVTPVRGPWSST